MPKSPPAHRVRASNFAHALANPAPNFEPHGQLTRSVTFLCPVGDLETYDFMAQRSGLNRTEVLLLLLSSGFAMVMEEMSPEARSSFHADLWEHMGSTSPELMDGVQKRFDLIAIDSDGKEI